MVVFDEKYDLSISFLLMYIMIHYRDCVPLYTSTYTITTTIITIITTVVIIVLSLLLPLFIFVLENIFSYLTAIMNVAIFDIVFL